MKKIVIILLAALLFVPGISAKSKVDGTFTVGKNEFLLNGKPFVIRAGELHYARIPRAYWDNRIKMVKAMGMNTICVYLFWNIHEQKQGVFNFKGQNDVAEFIRLIQKNGMYCILRPGPYVCAEWDMGGLPWWLLKKKDLQVRTRKDTFFMSATKKYLDKAGQILSRYQIQDGGPIIMVQVENEYGTWGHDSKYMEMIRDDIRQAGFDKVQLVRCDWSSNFFKYTLPGVANALNFGAGSNVDDQFRKFKQMHPNAPLMCGEYWTGWFDQWGRAHETRGVKSFIGSLKDMLDRKISFSLYMAHGGTSFGQWAGANAPAYAPTTSSYDYNAPIDEAGFPTDKFYAIRNLLKNYLQKGEKLAPIPKNPETIIKVKPVEFTQVCNLFDNLPKAKFTKNIKTMEFFNQGWGSIIYRKEIPACAEKQTLIINDVHDWARVFINGKLIGTLDRRFGDNSIELPVLTKPSRLDIFVEGMGRVNYGKAIIDRKGITHEVLLKNSKGETNLKDWTIYNLPVDYAFQKHHKFATIKANGPAWYKAHFKLDKTGYTYFDMSSWGKGMLWVNGHNMGRFWRIGPTQTLCIPGCYLKKGDNEIIVFDDLGPKKAEITGLDHPILDHLVREKRNGNKKSLNLNGDNPVISGNLSKERQWQTITFDEPVSGRYFCFQALTPQNSDDNAASIAEMEVIDTKGNTVSVLPWKVEYVDSQETDKYANGADKLFDQQESIIWQTKIGDKSHYPHEVVIDMGKVVNVKGFKILQRTDESSRGMVKGYNFYLQKNNFKFE